MKVVGGITPIKNAFGKDKNSLRQGKMLFPKGSLPQRDALGMGREE